MQPAVSRLESALAATEIRTPRIPVISNVDAQPHSDPDTIKQILARQVSYRPILISYCSLAAFWFKVIPNCVWRWLTGATGNVSCAMGDHCEDSYGQGTREKLRTRTRKGILFSMMFPLVAIK